MTETNVPNFENVYSTGVLLKFIKKDGSERVMFCTLNMDDIPEDYHPKNKDIIVTQNDIDIFHYHVFDCERLGWRCVPRNDHTVIRNLDDGEARKIIETNQSKGE